MNNGPKRGPGHGPAEQAKDFKSAIKRLLIELKSYHTLIVIALILAALSSILSITAPNKLSKLTDTISEGLIINSDNLQEINKNITLSLSEEKITTLITNVLELNINNQTTKEILNSNEISDEDKEIYQTILKKITKPEENKNLINNLSLLSKEVLSKILQTTTYNENTITIEDKINLIYSLEAFSNQKELNISDNVAFLLFGDLEIDKVTLSPVEQAEYLNVMSTLEKDSTTNEMYASLDKLSSNTKKVIEPKMKINKIKQIAIFLGTLYIASALFSFIQSISMTTVSNKFANTLRKKISIKINKLPLKYFDKHQSGDILSRVTNDVDTIAVSMNNSLATLVSALTLFLGTIIMMFITNWIMAITAIISSLIGFVFMSVILSKSQKYFVARQEELGNLNSHIEEVYSGLNVVKAYNGQKEANEKFDELNEKVYECNRKSQFLSGLMHPMMAFVGNLGYVAVCLVGAILTMNELTTFGSIVAFIVYVRLFTSPLSQIAQAMTSLQSTSAASERVFEFIDEEEMISQENIKTKLIKNKVKGKIEFENVVFKYDGNDEATIKDFSAIAMPGQKIAIVGPTGAGKTTMVNLLMKFYEINSGDIKIDGISTKDLTRENIHSLFTMVLQDTWLFDGTIKENIIYNRKNITNKKVEEVCEKVGVSHFINTFFIFSIV